MNAEARAPAWEGTGWWSEARRVPSPNCDLRPAGVRPELLVIHAISLPPDQFGGPYIEQLFCNGLNPDEHEYFRAIHTLRVSAHFLIRRDGEVLQFVAGDERAWHAGVSNWQGRERCNDFSIGIELEGCDSLPFEAVQYQALADLIRVLRQRYGELPLAGHSDVAPGRKTDPGPCFDWQALQRLIQA